MPTYVLTNISNSSIWFAFDLWSSFRFCSSSRAVQNSFWSRSRLKIVDLFCWYFYSQTISTTQFSAVSDWTTYYTVAPHELLTSNFSQIRKELDVTIDKTQSELSQVEQSLKAYTAVGDSFDNIVREYTYLKDEIESKKWALREFKHSLNSSLPVS